MFSWNRTAMMSRWLKVAVAFAALAATPARAADVVFPTGSKLGLVPPDGLTASETFRGFEDKTNNSAILMLEMPAQAFRDVEKAMTADALKKQGLILEKRETINIKNGKAILIVGRQNADGANVRKWVLVGGTPEMTALVTALIPDKAKNAYPDAAVRNALASIEVRGTIPIDEQIALLPFKLEDFADLRAFRVEPNTIFLTSGPKDSLDASEQALLVVSAAVGGPSETGSREIFARNLFSGIPGYKDVQIVGSDVIRLAGQQTYQLMAEAKDSNTGQDVKVVQWLRFGNGAFVRFLGIARADQWSDAFPRFRTVRDSLAAR